MDRRKIDFDLRDHNGNSVSLGELRGKVVLLFLGYTHCPDVCPMTLGVLKGAVEALDGGIGERVEVLFVSVDPARDTPRVLGGFVRHFSDRFYGVTGEVREFESLAAALGAHYEIERAEDSQMGYYVAHSSSLYLVNPEGELFLKYPSAKLSAAALAEDIERLVGRQNPSD